MKKTEKEIKKTFKKLVEAVGRLQELINLNNCESKESKTKGLLESFRNCNHWYLDTNVEYPVKSK